MYPEREYLKDYNKERFERCSESFNPFMKEFQAMLHAHTVLSSKRKQLDKRSLLVEEKKFKGVVDKLFEQGISTIKESSLKRIGAITQSNQVLMYPYFKEAIIKFDFSKGTVRTIHIYNNVNKLCYSLSQSVDTITVTSTPYQRIYGIVDMESNWKIK